MTQQQHQLNKRRRFAPETLPAIADSPLLDNLCDASPSQAEIEAQLLQVGMRVRKSVNEGYQTKRAFTPRPFFNSSRLSPETISALSAAEDSAMHRVGALSSQPISTATFCGISLASMSHISSAPAIGEQKLWSYSTASKRRQHFDEDSDSDDQEFMPKTPQLEGSDAGMPIPQDYFNIAFDSMDDAPEPHRVKANGRKIAHPRLRRNDSQQQPATINPFAQMATVAPAHGFGHQRMRSCGMEAMDFGEASFLQPRQDVEMDCS